MAHSVGPSLLVRAHGIRTLKDGETAYQSMSIFNGTIQALSAEFHGLDHLIASSTKIIDRPNVTVLPTFDDTHTHLYLAALGFSDVQVNTAKKIQDILDAIRQRVQNVPVGSWIRTASDWQEFNLEEQRFPTLAELDEVAPNNPVAVLRGGHNMVINSKAADAVGVTAQSSIPGGYIGHDDNGNLTGLMQDAAVSIVLNAMPSQTREQRFQDLSAASLDYARLGIGCIRDCMIPIHELPVLRAAHEAGKIHTRMKMLVSAIGVSDIEALLDEMENHQDLQQDPQFSIWGVKFMIDGGIETAATNEPYANPEPQNCGCAGGFRGQLLLEPETAQKQMEQVLARGWKVGTHAYGDRAVQTLLGIYERIKQANPNLPTGSLVMEHGGLADSVQRERAVRLGIPVTIQHPLLYAAAGVQDWRWGGDKVKDLFPVREWLDLGATVAAGSDFPVGSYGAMHSAWGMVTRQTIVGVKGQNHGVTVEEAISLHTTRAAGLLGDGDQRGTLEVGKVADFVLWEKDPLAVGSAEELRDLKPLMTVIDGKVVFERE